MTITRYAPEPIQPARCSIGPAARRAGGNISPASLAFGLRVLAEPPVRAAVADLGRRLGRIPPTPGRALDFEKERALRLLTRG